MIEEINTRVELMASPGDIEGKEKETFIYFFVQEHPLLYNMFIEAAAEIDEVLWLLGHYFNGCLLLASSLQEKVHHFITLYLWFPGFF